MTNFVFVPFGGITPGTNFFDTNRFVLSPWFSNSSPWLNNPWYPTNGTQTNLSLWPSNSLVAGLYTSNAVKNVEIWQLTQAMDTNWQIADTHFLNLETISNMLPVASIFSNNLPITALSGLHWTNPFAFQVQVGSSSPGATAFNVGVNDSLWKSNVTSDSVILQSGEWISWTNGSGTIARWKPL